MRHATENDLPAIVEIYNASIPSRMSTADLAPVTVESRRAWFLKHSPERYPLLVEEADGEIAAWAGLHPFYDRPAYRFTAEISVYVSPACQGRGLGNRITGAIIQSAREAGLKTLIAFVFLHNERSLKLFQSNGFTEWGRLPDVTTMDGREYSVVILGNRIQP